MQDPDTINSVSMSISKFVRSKDSWLFWGNTVYNDGNGQKLSISTSDVVEGNSISCCITRGGDLEIYINGKKKAVGWHNVPVDKPLWGVVCMYDMAIQSEFYCGELYLYKGYSVSHSCACACMYISICSLHIILKPVILQ